MHTKSYLRILKARDQTRDLDVDGIQLAQNRGPVAGSCDSCDELLGSIKFKEFLSKLIKYHIFKKPL